MGIRQFSMGARIRQNGGWLFLFLSFFFASALAAIPQENIYQVKLRSYAVEPELRRFTISGEDEAFLIKPTILNYTQLNPLDPEAIYTVPPYPQTEFLPKLGKWMTVMSYDSQPVYLLSASRTKLSSGKKNVVPAHWVSLTNTQGQYIIEPINYVFVVYKSGQKQPVELLNSVLRKAGFSSSFGKNHSSGYYAYIGDQLLSQLATPSGQALTYSNRDFRLQNDHFRIFGAYHLDINHQPAAIFVASISEESGYKSELANLPNEALTKKIAEMSQQNANGEYYESYGHHFVSFANARNNLAVALIKAGYPTYYSSLGNVVNTLGESTEDHDGKVYVTVIR